MSLPLSLLFGKWQRFVDLDGNPIAGGSLNFYEAGTTTPLAVYADADGVTSLGATVTLDASGHPSSGSATTPVFLQPEGYKLIVLDASSATLPYTTDGIEDVGATFLATEAVTQSQGTKSITTVYTVSADDNLITLNGATVTLQPAADRGTRLIILNTGAASTVTPNGSETINGVAGAFNLSPATLNPVVPSMDLYSDGVSNYYAIITNN